MTSLKAGLNTDRNPYQVLVAVRFLSGMVAYMRSFNAQTTHFEKSNSPSLYN